MDPFDFGWRLGWCTLTVTEPGPIARFSEDLQRQISTEQEQLDREKKELRDFQGQLDNLKSSGLSSGTPVAEPPAAPKKKPTMILEREGV